MKSGKWWLLLLVPFVAVIGIDARDETACRTSKDCKGKHEDCIGGMCHCEKGALSWAGADCLTKRHFGETCQDQNECLMSNDPHLDCIELDAGGPKLCMCTNKMHFNFGSKLCEPFEVKIMNPETKVEIDLAGNPTHEDIGQLPNHNSFREYLETRYIDPTKTKSGPKKPNFSDANFYFGPLIVALMALIVITICCCFWRIDPRAPHDIDIERERSKAVEKALAELQLDGQSNFGFQPDDWNCDTVSRYTATTEVADEKDSGSKCADIRDENGNGGAKSKVRQDKPKTKKVEKTKEAETEQDCKRKSGALEQQTEAYKTLEEIKVTPGNGTKVQGPPEAGQHQDNESKSRAIESWMKGHMDQIDESQEESELSGSYNPFKEDPFDTNPFKEDPIENNSHAEYPNDKNPFKEDPFGKKSAAEILERRIELVETDDCTSLDTTVNEGTRTYDEIVMNPAALIVNQDQSITSTLTLQPHNKEMST